jgi:hypothetical protein
MSWEIEIVSCATKPSSISRDIYDWAFNHILFHQCLLLCGPFYEVMIMKGCNFYSALMISQFCVKLTYFIDVDTKLSKTCSITITYHAGLHVDFIHSNFLGPLSPPERLL